MKIILKVGRQIYGKIRPNNNPYGRNWKLFPLKEYANNLISDGIKSDKPIMIARLGATELNCMVNYLSVKTNKDPNRWKLYLTNQISSWWWSKEMLMQIQNWSGFFPSTPEMVEKFCELMIEDLKCVDILGSWLKEEAFFKNELSFAKKVMLEDLEPFFCKDPWTHALNGKKVLVIHPFSETIKNQFLKRNLIYPNGTLPDFELEVIPAVQTLGGEGTSGYRTWFEALKSMKNKIDNSKFDICILGCGAYGFPLAAHIKRGGGKAIHMGGITQLLFGIKGKRWENHIVYPYTNLFNDYWVRPSNEETPISAESVEGSCYW